MLREKTCGRNKTATDKKLKVAKTPERKNGQVLGQELVPNDNGG